MTRAAPLAGLAGVLVACACTAAQGPRDGPVRISAILVDPTGVPDSVGEWLEVANLGTRPVDLAGWTLASARDRPHRISRRVVVPAGNRVALARNGDPARNGGVRAGYVYGPALAFANRADWVALRAPGGVTADSVAWRANPGRGIVRRRTDLRASGGADLAGPAWGGSASGGDRTASTRTESSREASARAGVAGAPIYRNHLEFGVPTDGDPSDDVILRKPQYVVSYNPQRRVANWVAWNLNRTHYGAAPRSNVFLADPALPARLRPAVSSDYSGSGYNRGHLVRSDERTATAEDNAATFLLTNIVPQRADLNTGPWLRLEDYVRRLALRDGRELYLLAGGIFPREPRTLAARGKVAIPDSVWKIVVVLPPGAGLREAAATPGALRVLAVNMPNVNGIARRSWRDYLTSVDAIERSTGYDFLAALPDSLERVVEARVGR